MPGRPPNYSATQGGAKKPSNPAADSPSRPGTHADQTSVRARVIKNKKSLPKAKPEASAYQQPAKPQDNKYPGLPHVQKRNQSAPGKDPSDTWHGTNVDPPPSRSQPKAPAPTLKKRRGSGGG